MSDVRLEELSNWSRQQSLPVSIPKESVLKPVSDDASFRRYFRFDPSAPGLIFVDAPPDQEDNPSFVKIAAALAQAGLTCPAVFAADIERGYLVISDLGDQLYQTVVERHPEQIRGLYDEAVAALIPMISVRCDIPEYSASKLDQEASLFADWFVSQQLGLSVSEDQRAMLRGVCELMVKNAIDQPKGFVHRDYHCRNLLIQEVDGPGIIDFQDAVMGPVTYDLVSLFKDCYYKFSRSEVEDRVQAFHQQLTEQGLVSADAPFLRWFDWMGIQRHMKCAGIFSRLNLRDGKPAYLGDIPLVVDYLIEASSLYDELREFNAWLTEEIKPRMSDPEFSRETA